MHLTRKENMRSILHACSALVLFAAITALVSGCDHEGLLITAPSVTRGTISLLAMTDERYVVTIDDRPFGDTLRSNGQSLSGILVEKTEGPQHLVIVNVSDQSVVIDSMITLDTPGFTYLLLQLEAPAKPILLSNADSEPLPGADSVKIRFLYTDTNLPSAIKMRFYYIDEYTFETEVFDSVTLVRSTIGPYVTRALNHYPGSVLQGFDILDASDGHVIQAFDLDPSSPRFTEGVMWTAPFFSGTLIAKKQTLLLEFGETGYLQNTYKDRYLFGSDE